MPRLQSRVTSMRAGVIVAVIVALSAGLPAQEKYAHPDVDLRGRLYRAVFQAAPPYLSSGDIAGLPDDLRSRLSTFLVRRSAFKSAYEGGASGFEEAARDARKRAIERAIVSTVDHPLAARLALEFIKDAPIAFEWEGKPQGPADEAEFAERFLAKDPSSPLAPFLYVFIAHRQRVAYEAYGQEKAPDGQKAAARKYRTFLQRARSAKDPIFALIADDMDRQAYLYIRTDTHPRDFNPDG